MERFRQYRMMKKVQKLMDTPAQEEVYNPTENLFPTTDQDLRQQDDGLTSDRLRATQVDRLATLVLQQIDRIHRWTVNQDTESDLARRHVIEEAFGDIEILFEELESGLLLSESERRGRKQSNSGWPARITHREPSKNELPPLQRRIEEWQKEKRQKTNRLNRTDTSIRQLALNIHDSRCKQVLVDRKSLIDSLDKSISSGVAILHDVNRQLQVLYAGRPAAPS